MAGGCCPAAAGVYFIKVYLSLLMIAFRTASRLQESCNFPIILGIVVDGSASISYFILARISSLTTGRGPYGRGLGSVPPVSLYSFIIRFNDV
jgi:hypothetical protein